MSRPATTRGCEGGSGPHGWLRLLCFCLCALVALVRGEQDSCKLSSSGRMPSPGACAGPLGRTFLVRANAVTYNNGCPIDQIAYYKDGNTSSTPLCGECLPGTAGVDDQRRLCGVNEYCTDDAVCVRVKSSPLYRALCPYEGGGMCGPGLYCIEHECVVCEEGVYDSTDGKTCNNGEWTYSEWDTLGDDPEAVFLLVILCLFVIVIVSPFFSSWRKGYIAKWMQKSGLLRRAKRWRPLTQASYSARRLLLREPPDETEESGSDEKDGDADGDTPLEVFAPTTHTDRASEEIGRDGTS